MALSYKARRRWALVVLVVGMPIYVILCIGIVGGLDRPSMWVEFAIYGGLGIAWVLPFKGLFKGIGQVDPDAPKDE